MIEPNALVGRSPEGGIHVGWSASASSVRQMPPPAVAIHTRQSPGTHAGSEAIALTRPDSCVAGPCCVVGSKNWEASPATSGVDGPKLVQAPGAAASAVWKRVALRNEDRGAVLGMRLKDLAS